MTEAHPCLLSTVKTASKYRYFPFLQDQVKIGRATDVTYTILSTTISRCHAIINRQEDNTWTITDNKSLNGISVNGRKLQALEPCTLQAGDIVQLGVPASPEVPPEFVYRFFPSLKVRKENSAGWKRASAESSPSKSKRHKGSEHDGDKNLAGEGGKENTSSSHMDPEQAEAEARKEQEKLKQQYEEQLQKLAQQLKEQEQEKWAIVRQLELEREERQVMEEKQKEQEERVNELDIKQKQLAAEKAAAEEALRHQMEEKLKEREEALRSQMQQQLGLLAAEKRQVEERLQKEMEKAVQEKDKELQEQLQGEKCRLQKIIENKELEQKALESQLAQSRVENERARADSLLARESVLSEFAVTMETELQCAICNELFIKATILSCSHAFCSLCLRQWLDVKKECPNCRAVVTSQMHSIVMDNYIDRMVEQLSTEMKQRRIQLVAERKEEERKLIEAQNSAIAGPSGLSVRGRNQTHNTRGRRRGRGRRSASYLGLSVSPAATGPAATVAAITAASIETRAAARQALPTSSPFSVALANIAARRDARAHARTEASAMTAATGATASATTATAGSTEGDTTASAAAAAEEAAATEAAVETDTASEVPAVAATVTIGFSDESDSLDVAATENGSITILVSEDESDSVMQTDSEQNYSQDSFDESEWFTSPAFEQSDDSSDDEDEDFLPGTSGSYYGGFGRCFKCGMRGHWARGCPVR